MLGYPQRRIRLEAWDNRKAGIIRYLIVTIDFCKTKYYLKFILDLLYVAIQHLLTSPNPGSPAQHDAFVLLSKNPPEYKKRVRLEAAKNAPEQ